MRHPPLWRSVGAGRQPTSGGCTWRFFQIVVVVSASGLLLQQLGGTPEFPAALRLPSDAVHIPDNPAVALVEAQRATLPERDARWNLGVCGLISRDQTSTVAEWVELHRASGVDHVWLFYESDLTKKDLRHIGYLLNQAVSFATVANTSVEEAVGSSGLAGSCPSEDGSNGSGDSASTRRCVFAKMCHAYAAEHVNYLTPITLNEFLYPHIGCDLSSYISDHCSPDASYISPLMEELSCPLSSPQQGAPQENTPGLMSEKFLTSAGSCSSQQAARCGGSRVIYNVRSCATSDHFGNLAHPVNTSDWKAVVAASPGSPHAPTSPGTSSLWKGEQCIDYTGSNGRGDRGECAKWLSGGTLSPQGLKDTGCCSAGIGIGHYAVRRQAEGLGEVAESAHAAEEVLDATISFGALRFVRSLKKRLRMSVVSGPSAFVSVAPAQQGEEQQPVQEACFIERGYRYFPEFNSGTAKVRVSAASPKACCTSCVRYDSCKGFSFNLDGYQCDLLVPSEEVTVGGVSTRQKRWPKTLLPATRQEADSEWFAGIRLVDECRV